MSDITSEDEDIGEKLEREWKPYIEKLRSEGFQARVTSPVAPLQLEGTLPTGEAFYFRSEWGGASLNIGGETPWLRPAWMSKKNWDDPKRGEEKPEVAVRDFRALLERWRTGEPDMRKDW
jgi:hypothetical protein